MHVKGRDWAASWQILDNVSRDLSISLPLLESESVKDNSHEVTSLGSLPFNHILLVLGASASAVLPSCLSPDNMAILAKAWPAPAGLQNSCIDVCT